MNARAGLTGRAEAVVSPLPPCEQMLTAVAYGVGLVWASKQPNERKRKDFVSEK